MVASFKMARGGTSPECLRARFRGMSRADLVATAARVRTGPVDSPEAAAKVAPASMARPWLTADAEVRIPMYAQLVHQVHPRLPDAFRRS